jgi:ADP-L-glycero-D-manno-heptose 6-epimerase
VIQANIKACAPKKSGVYNVGTSKPRSFQDIADILQKELGTDYGTEYFPNPFTGYQMHTQADISTSTENLGYTPEWELEEGIKDYISDIKKMYDEEVLNG